MQETNTGIVYANSSSPPPLIQSSEMSTDTSSTSPLRISKPITYMQHLLVDTLFWLVLLFDLRVSM